jgi:hypothetical protein
MCITGGDPMSFDPEKVERLPVTFQGALGMYEKIDYVAASDYDQLLALYREICGRHWPAPIKQQ